MSVNKVILVGNVGSDPEVRYLDNHVAVANFNLATTERGYTTSSGVTVPERTEWHRIVLWRGLAETAEKYVRKGSQLYIEGRIQSRTYTNKEGQERTVVEIQADTMQLLGRRADNNNAEPAAAAPAAAPAPKGKESKESKKEGEDLPF
ncbi:MAG: single-stranded DNA-binding protein [Paludibacteraceae bacterium]|nr:single-stranded DNA-binding protein [Paludibacteraceae bacterium]